MSRRTFIRCLNKQHKIYNLSIESIIGCSIGLVLGLTQGLLWGVGSGAVGLSIGAWVGKMLYIGNLQRLMYWHLPYTRNWLGRSVPDSADREEL